MRKKKKRCSAAGWGCRPGTAKYERALEIYNNAPETVRTPAQQKAYERSLALKSNEEEQKKSIHIKSRRPRARIISGGLPSLGKRQ